MKEYWTKNFYQIEQVGNTKQIHIMGYFYDEGDDAGGGKTSRCVEYNGCIVELSKYLSMDWYDRDEFEAQCRQYIEDMTPEQAVEAMNHYYDGNPPTELLLMDITVDTPCGCYVDA